MPTSRSLRSGVLGALSALGLARLAGATGPRILLYHGVTGDGGAGIFNYRHKFIDTTIFRAQLAWLKASFDILPLASFVERHAAGSLSERALAITFDDGYANNYTDAFPVLRGFGIPATFFITSGFIEGAPLPVDRVEYAVGATALPSLLLPWTSSEHTFSLKNRKERVATDLAIRTYVKKLAEPEPFLATLEERAGARLAEHLFETPYRPMTWEQMREMEAVGMSFAPHTRTHAILSRLSREVARQEITASGDALNAHLAHPLSTIFAYPNGGAADFTDETITLLKELGFVASLTTSARPVAPGKDPFRLPRFTMDGTTTLSRARLAASGAYARLARLARLQ